MSAKAEISKALKMRVAFRLMEIAPLYRLGALLRGRVRSYGAARMNANVEVVDVGRRQIRQIDVLGFETVEGIQRAIKAHVSAHLEKDFAAGFAAGNAIQPGADPA